MSMLALLISIPIFCIGLVMYIMTLFNYVFLDNLDVPLLIIGLLIVIIFSFIIVKLFYKNLSKTPRNLNSMLNSQNIYNNFIFIIILLLGFVLFIKPLNKNFASFDCIIGLTIMIITLHGISNYFLGFKEEKLKLVDIKEITDKIKCLRFVHEKYGEFTYYTNEDDYKIDNLYDVVINKKTKVIRAIKNKVYNID